MQSGTQIILNEHRSLYSQEKAPQLITLASIDEMINARNLKDFVKLNKINSTLRIKDTNITNLEKIRNTILNTILIQKSARGYFARKLINSRTNSTILIQKNVRGYFARIKTFKSTINDQNNVLSVEKETINSNIDQSPKESNNNIKLNIDKFLTELNTQKGLNINSFECPILFTPIGDLIKDEKSVTVVTNQVDIKEGTKRFYTLYQTKFFDEWLNEQIDKNKDMFKRDIFEKMTLDRFILKQLKEEEHLHEDLAQIQMHYDLNLEYIKKDHTLKLLENYTNVDNKKNMIVSFKQFLREKLINFVNNQLTNDGSNFIKNPDLFNYLDVIFQNQTQEDKLDQLHSNIKDFFENNPELFPYLLKYQNIEELFPYLLKSQNIETEKKINWNKTTFETCLKLNILHRCYKDYKLILFIKEENLFEDIKDSFNNNKQYGLHYYILTKDKIYLDNLNSSFEDSLSILDYFKETLDYNNYLIDVLNGLYDKNQEKVLNLILNQFESLYMEPEFYNLLDTVIQKEKNNANLTKLKIKIEFTIQNNSLDTQKDDEGTNVEEFENIENFIKNYDNLKTKDFNFKFEDEKTINEFLIDFNIWCQKKKFTMYSFYKNTLLEKLDKYCIEKEVFSLQLASILDDHLIKPNDNFKKLDYLLRKVEKR